jgi:UDP-N-acetylmuramoyl-L-alanyl-D-glutamate--2,6-diaminopimelate ligase
MQETNKQQIELKQLLANWLLVPDSANVTITGVSLNSKTVKPGDLFFAYPGTTVDGRRYIENAVENGAVAVLAEANLGISENLEYETSTGKKIPLLTLPDLAMHCSAIAGEFYGNPSRYMQVIGITGTNGKTSCAYYLAAAFTKLGVKSALMGTIGSGIYGEDIVSTGLTTSDAVRVQKILAEFYYAGVKFVTMEVSSHALSQGRVNGVDFDRAVFTNLSQDHLDYHQTMREYWFAKKILFEYFDLNNAIINAKDQHGRELLLSLWGTQYVCGYTLEPIPPEMEQLPLVTAHDVKFTRDGMSARIHTPWGIGYLSSPQIGRYNLMNLLAVITTMGTMGVHLDDILHCILDLPVVPGRMQSVLKQDAPLAIIDYAHTPDALENVLAVLREHCEGKLWCVFGCGGSRDVTKREVMGEIVERLADKVIVTDDNPRAENPEDIVTQILQGMKKPKNCVVEHDRAKAIAYALEHADKHDTVLIAGKGHETYQHIGDEKRHFSDLEHVQSVFNRKS